MNIPNDRLTDTEQANATIATLTKDNERWQRLAETDEGTLQGMVVALTTANDALKGDLETLKTANATLKTTADTATAEAQRAIAASGIKVPVSVKDPEQTDNGLRGLARAQAANIAQQRERSGR